ncbi:hypothetical protein GLOIN_2v1872702 [Rhizophagus clarus]|uniref:Uncharacterized protein n=1 Tax=Rhizophagus clarus TaxID=94130 RepID=A0A8H3QDY2_9GLOM|nr:hypothetical protein GLOIN_2v1872702 [Rhizophagus clarus]
MFCSGDGNTCQQVGGGIGSCNEGCENSQLTNCLKDYQDMHLCKVRVKIPKVQRLNLLQNIKDNILISRRAGHRNAKGIKAKLLASMNGTKEDILSEAINSQKIICTDDKLRQLVAPKNNAGFATPIAFGMSNKENNYTIRLAISLLKNNNILYNQVNCDHAWYYEDLSNNTGFKRITPYSSTSLWDPIAIIDKHKPFKLGVDNLLSRTIFC